MTEQAKSESHDPDFPEAFLQFMRDGWREDALAVSPVPEVPNYAKRRAALSEAFPGETLIIPTGNEKVRANDTDYPFRPGSDFVYLTGDRDPDSVLVLRPSGSGHDAVLYTRQRNSKDTDEFFRSRDGELWVGRRHTLGEKSTELGIETAAVRLSWAAALAELRAGPYPGAARAGRRRRPGGPGLRAGPVGAPRPRAGRVISELKLVKDEWEIAQLQEAVDATVRGFEDVARVLPADRGGQGAPARGRLRAAGPVRRQRRRLRLDRRRRRARDDPALDPQHRHDRRRASCC